MDKQIEALKLALEALDCPGKAKTADEQAAITAIREALAEQPAPPPECQTEAEKTAFAFGWWKALEQKRKADSALDRMAENARELGLDYEPAQQEPVELDPKDVHVEVVTKQMGGFAPVMTNGVRLTHKPTGTVVEETAERSAHRNRDVAWKRLTQLVTSPKPAQPAQQHDPVAVYVGETWCGSVVRLYEDLPLETPLYTSPQPSKPVGVKPWVPLTEFDIDQISYSCSHADSRLIAFAIEAKLKEKNA